ncbi:NlpC/P60 family protein [Streptomyces somaliensis]|uniref:C40 family peptidase n=1 Tax=Streptomyces somaliensis TaxID=78355 RepID=UPI0020CEE8DF|nr:C40 family peptidase [Streptomyces somaliensis]MCP9946138.1 NlpC/P60 family protein [Streptomyces somaliensis]MCP9973480.1 NlpC/P60 family protein [Streptomyces somaliensis]
MASHRRPTHPGPHRGTATALLSAAAATAAAFGATPVKAEPAAPADTVRARVDRLHAEAERAAEEFNAADERADKLRRTVEAARDEVARGQERVNRVRGALGSIAGAQYRSGGIDPALALMLSEEPGTYLDKAAALERLGERQVGLLAELRLARRHLDQERAEATRLFAELERDRAAAARYEREVERKLAAARRLLNSLPSEERDAFDRASRAARGEAPPPRAGGAASPRAAAAVRAARSAVGRPYAWGANGPGAFDCSGLTQWAYAQAGVGLPRTSQAQRDAGRHVALSEARPGDLVTYRSDASHVAMYVGHGRVVHAPYPGARVRYDPVGMMPVSAVTRV